MRCEHYRITTRQCVRGYLAARCRRRARYHLRVGRGYDLCATCLPDVLALRADVAEVVAVE